MDLGGGQTYYNRDLHMNGINTTRGRAAEAIRDLILIDAAYIDRFRSTLDRMILDRKPRRPLMRRRDIASRRIP